MSTWSFRNLNLANVEVQRGSTRLKPGRYIVKVTGAKVEPLKSGNGFRLSVEMAEVNNAGTMTDYITLKHATSADAERIGRERLKALLTYGGHPTPNEPGDVSSLKGLIVGLSVVESEFERDGETRKGAEPAKYGAYFDPTTLGYERAPARAGVDFSHPDFDAREDSEIPF